MEELIEAVSEVYEETKELALTAAEFDMSPLKIRKILITAGIYHTPISDEVNRLYYKEGKTVAEIMEITGLKKSSVNGYLPYSKVIYKSTESSDNAIRIQNYRRRKEAVEILLEQESQEALWDAVVAFENYPFHTTAGKAFHYVLQRGEDGEYTKEMWICRGKKRESMPWNLMIQTYQAALEGKIVTADIGGISYLYPILLRFGVIL